MNFWRLNFKKIISISVLQFMGWFLFTYFLISSDDILFAACYSFFSVFLLSLIYILAAVNSFKVIRRLTKDSTELSVMPLFDSGYTIALQFEKSRFSLTTPCITGEISGLPVIISFLPRAHSKAFIGFQFYPLLGKDGYRGYTNDISFPVSTSNRLTKDVKPEVLTFAAETIKSGYSSGLEKGRVD